MPAKATYRAVWNDQTETRTSTRPVTHAAVYRLAGGREVIGSWHGSETAARRGSNGMTPIVVVPATVQQPAGI